MKTIGKTQLVSILSKVDSPQNAHLLALTKLNARKNPYGKIYKLNYINTKIGIDYEKEVNDELEKIGKERNFKVQPRIFGTHINSCLIEYGKRIYLATKILGELSLYLYKGKNGIEYIDEKEIEKYIRKTESIIKYRTFNIDNLIKISLDKDKYRIKNENAEINNPNDRLLAALGMNDGL